MTAAQESGSALLPAVSVLAMLSALSIMALMAGGADLLLATRLSRERAAFYAAEAAIETALLEISRPGGALPEEVFFPPWPAPGIPVRRWRDGDWSCARSVSLVPDVRDSDGDPATPVVLFNRRFGFAESPVEGGGFPVVQVLALADGGQSRQAIAAEVAPVTCAPRVAAAWTVSGPLDLAGDIRVTGSSPALVARGAVRLAEGTAIGGEIAVDPDLPLPGDLLEILAAGGTLDRIEDLPEPEQGEAVRGVAWSRADYAGPLDGEGILVVHNPAFDPARHEASRRAIEEGVYSENFDPAYSHLDPSRQPARLEILREGRFRGVIIADIVGTFAEHLEIVGGLITLSRSPQSVQGQGALTVTYDADAVQRSGRGPLRHVTAFRPLSEPPAQLR